MLLLSYSHGNGDTGNVAVSESRDALIGMAMSLLEEELHQQGEIFDQSLSVTYEGPDEWDWTIMYNGGFDSALSYAITEIKVV